MGIGDLAVGRDAGFGHVEDSVGAKRHESADTLGGAAEIVGQAGAPDRLVGVLEKFAQIQGLVSDTALAYSWAKRIWRAQA